MWLIRLYPRLSLSLAMRRSVTISEAGLTYLGSGTHVDNIISFKGVLGGGAIAFLLIGSRPPQKIEANTNMVVEGHSESMCIRMQNVRSGSFLKVSVTNIAYQPEDGCGGKEEEEEPEEEIEEDDSYTKRKAFFQVQSHVPSSCSFQELIDDSIIEGYEDIEFRKVSITVNGVDALENEYVIVSPTEMNLELTQELWREDILTIEFYTLNT